MSAQYIPQQQDFIPDRRDTTAGVPSLQSGKVPNDQVIDKKILDNLFKKYRAAITLEIKAQNFLDIMQLANIYFVKGEYPKAEKLYESVIKKNKNYLPAYDKIIASILLQFPSGINNLNEVHINTIRNKIDKYYLKYLETSNRRTDILHNYVIFRISLFLDQKEYIANEALENLNEILGKEPKNYAAMDTKGFVYLNYLTNIQEAKKWFEKALVLNKSYPFSLNNLAVCLTKIDELKEAKNIFIKLTQQNENFALAFENLGNIQKNEKDYKNALANLEQAMKLEKNLSRDGYHNLAFLYSESGQLDKSIDLYKFILIQEPYNYLVMNNMGTAYVRKNDRETAKKYYLGAIKAFTKNPPVQLKKEQSILPTLYNLARTAIDTKDFELLDKVEAMLVEFNPKDSFINYIDGCRELLNENYSKASKIFKKLIKRDKSLHKLM